MIKKLRPLFILLGAFALSYLLWLLGQVQPDPVEEAPAPDVIVEILTPYVVYLIAPGFVEDNTKFDLVISRTCEIKIIDDKTGIVLSSNIIPYGSSIFVKNGKIPYPVPNPRIVDEYALWIILSRIGVYPGLFATQDVTQGYVEQKHEEFFNPIVIHYTTKGEQRMAEDDERFSNLLRDVDEYGEQIDPYHTL